MNTRVVSILALIVALAIFFGYVTRTWSGSIADTQAAIANDDDALASASAYAAHQNELAAARNAINPTDLARLVTFLPDSVDNVGLILDLDVLAAHSGLALSNIDVMNNSSASTASSGNAAAIAGASSGPVGSIDLSLSAIGTYTALRSFLHGVEQSGRLLDVRDLLVKGSNTGAYDYQMTLRLYWLR